MTDKQADKFIASQQLQYVRELMKQMTPEQQEAIAELAEDLAAIDRKAKRDDPPQEPSIH
jgi:hypothetical protein